MIMSMSLNLTIGYTGLMNFGHIALMGAGAYTSAIVTKTYDLPIIVGIVGAGLFAMALSALLALPAKKIRGDYYALVTLGFMFVMQAALINFDSLTRGTLGIPGISRPELFSGNTEYLVLVVLVTVATFLFLDRVVSSPFGRALEAVRDDEDVAQALGKPVFKLKVQAMMISGFFVGIAGGLFAHFIQFISPSSFWLDLLVWALAGMMLGGIASMRGTILGVLLLFAFTEPVRFLSIPSALVGPVRLGIIMLAILFVVLIKPRGFMGRAELEN